MPSPFPGMDPYPEDPELWPDVHSRLIAGLDQQLLPQLPPDYFVSMEERVYIAEAPEPAFIGRPDATIFRNGSNDTVPRSDTATIAAAGAAAGTLVLPAEVPLPDRRHETYLEVRRGREVVAVIEVLSPFNKRPGAGREEYEQKRLQTLGTRTHLVEIDLLRGGQPLPIRLRDWPVDAPLPGNYRILVARGDRRPHADLYAFTLHDPIPPFRLPLGPGDDEPLIGLQSLVGTIYDHARYARRLEYQRDPIPPLRPDDAVWADTLLREHGLR